MRPMRSMWVNEQDHVFGQLPKYRDTDATEVEITLPSITTNDLGKYDDKEGQYGDFTYAFSSLLATRQGWPITTPLCR